ARRDRDLPPSVAREADASLAGYGTPRAGKRGFRPAPCCLVFDALDGLAAWCARARRRPARAQRGLRLSPRYADVLVSGLSPGCGSNVSTPHAALAAA